jgi:Ion channel
MLSVAVTACALVAVTVVVHAVGLAVLLKTLLGRHTQLPTRVWPMIRLVVGLTWALILIHLIEVAIWALFFLWAECLPDAEAAFYFSGVTYATVGYGDVVLPQPWRILGPLEGLTGILMCGLSTGFFFAVFSRILGARLKTDSQ